MLPYVRVERHLRRRIGAGEWGPGEQLPTTAELASYYSVSPGVIQRAMGKLADDGLVLRVARWGVFMPGGDDDDSG